MNAIQAAALNLYNDALSGAQGKLMRFLVHKLQRRCLQMVL